MTWEEMTSIAAEEGFAAAVVTDTKDIPLTPSFRPALCRESLCGKIRRKLLPARPTAARAGRDAAAHSGAPPCPRAPDDLGDRGLQRQQGHQGREKRTQRRNCCACSAVCAARRSGFPRRGQRLRPVARRAPSWNTSPAAIGPVLFLYVGLLSSCAGSRRSAAWNMTAGRACWPFSACTFLTERKETPWIQAARTLQRHRRPAGGHPQADGGRPPFGLDEQVLLGVTGSGKTFTMASVTQT